MIKKLNLKLWRTQSKIWFFRLKASCLKSISNKPKLKILSTKFQNTTTHLCFMKNNKFQWKISFLVSTKQMKNVSNFWKTGCSTLSTRLTLISWCTICIVTDSDLTFRKKRFCQFSAESKKWCSTSMNLCSAISAEWELITWKTSKLIQLQTTNWKFKLSRARCPMTTFRWPRYSTSLRAFQTTLNFWYQTRALLSFERLSRHLVSCLTTCTTKEKLIQILWITRIIVIALIFFKNVTTTSSKIWRKKTKNSQKSSFK